jgi:hypothetical protein
LEEAQQFLQLDVAELERQLVVLEAGNDITPDTP